MSRCQTTQKMLTASKPYGHSHINLCLSISTAEIFDIPIFLTTQNKDRLGDTVPDLGLHDAHASRVKASINKSKFSMVVPELLTTLESISQPTKPACIIVGIESHICVTQTALDLLERGYPVYILADGVSSCNREEVPIALRRLASAGATVTSSESILYEICGDAGRSEFKALGKLVRESKDKTTDVLNTLCKI